MKKKQLLLGAHMSIAGGFEQAIIRGEELECTAIQIFTKSNRQWAAKPITVEQANLFKETLQKSSSVQFVMAHASYLINIGSADKTAAEKSVKALIEELKRCHTLGIPYLVLHPGAYTKTTLEESIHLISEYLNYAFDEDPGSTIVLLENTAGQGKSVGSTFEQLRAIYKKVKKKKRIGFCFDTCHAFAAGYDFTTPEKYKALWKHFDEVIGIEHLKAFHINDSVKGLGSHVDRHSNIGKGKIGIEAFRLIMNDPRFSDIPKVLETPKVISDMEQDQINLNLLRSLLEK